jgi:hypothetical protein
MYIQKIVRPTVCVAVLLPGVYLGSASFAQQPTATPSADQEFLDSTQ